MRERVPYIRICSVLVSLFVLLAYASAQKPTPTPKPPDPNLVRWKIFLDTLEQQSRGIVEERKAYVVSDIAAAYWELDRDEATTQLISALDVAWKVVSDDKKKRPVLNYVFSTAAKLDPSLIKVLNERLVKKEGAEKEANNIQGSTFYDFLETDPERAAQMLEAYAPNGLENGMGISLLLQLAHKDLQLANRVYNTYLNKVMANESIPLEAILPLAGFAFGYSESWTMNRRGDGSGSSVQVVRGLTANATNTPLFLTVAHRRLTKAIEQRNNAPGTDVESLSYPILFTFGYLLPEVANFSPSSLAMWRQLQQDGVVGTTHIQAQKVADFLSVIIPHRAKMQNYSASPESQEIETEESLENVEKIVGTCERDVVYTKAAIVFSYQKKFKRALELVGNIKGEKQLELAGQVVATSMAIDLIENGEFEKAETEIKKVVAHGPKAILNSRLATGMIRQNDKPLAGKTIDQTVTLTEKLSDPTQRSGLLLALSAILLKSDSTEARALLEKAIKELNKQEAADVFKFTIPVRVPYGCGTDPPMYWGDLSLPNSTILDVVRLFAVENHDVAAIIVDTISDKPLKVRAEAIVAKSALVKAKRQSAK